MMVLINILMIPLIVLSLGLSYYLSLCFISWIGDVIENKSWRGLWD
jgi:hypothetical protein